MSEILLPNKQQLDSLNTKLDKIISGENLANVQIKGNTLEDGQMKVKLVSSEVALPVDIQFHNLKEEMLMFSELERAIKLQTGMRTDFYYDGVEYSEWEFPAGVENGSATKEEEHLELIVENNPNKEAYYSFVTKSTIDLTDINFLYFDISSSSSDTQYNKRIVLGVADTKGQPYNVMPVKKEIIFRSSKYERSIIRLNTRNVIGEKYIKMFALDTSVHVDTPQILKIFRVWGEK